MFDDIAADKLTALLTLYRRDVITRRRAMTREERYTDVELRRRLTLIHDLLFYLDADNERYRRKNP